MTKAIEELRIATNWAMAGDAKAAADFAQSALLALMKAEEKDQPE